MGSVYSYELAGTFRVRGEWSRLAGYALERVWLSVLFGEYRLQARGREERHRRRWKTCAIIAAAPPLPVCC